MRVIVCGGRDFSDANQVNQVLDELHERYGFTVLCHGNAKGADMLADKWAQKNNVLVMAYPADWHGQGKAAGPIRNRKMAESGAMLLIAFPGGKGTANMKTEARKAGVRIIDIGKDL